MTAGHSQTSVVSVLHELARCVAASPEGVCRGQLNFGSASAICQTCGQQYPVHRDVPVLRRDIDADALRWYDESYAGRNRLEDIATDYLRPQRDQVTALVREYRLTGPSLDIGCGTGIFADAVPNYVGLEYSPAALMAEGFERYARVAGDARELPFAGQSFELIISFNVIEHVDDVAKVFAEIDRVLRPGGMIMIKPAWHCQKYTTELIPIRRYGQLNWRQKCVKAALPIIKSRPYKLATWVPWRCWRRLTAQANNPLRWSNFEPNFGPEWIEDADACSNIDIHEASLYFETRGYQSISHPNLLSKLMAGHDLLVMKKGRPGGPQNA